MFGGINNPTRFFLRGLAVPVLVGWLFLVPLALIVPKRRGLILFIGFSGLFADNVKYLFLYSQSDKSPGTTALFLASSDEQFELLSKAGLAVIRGGTLRSIWCQLRASAVVVDTVSWLRPLRFFVLFRARRIQLWHGCPLKVIERDDMGLYGPLVPFALRVMHALSGRFAKIDLLLSTSRFFTKTAFVSAFWSRKIVEDNYPRNDVFFHKSSAFEIGVDELAAMRIKSGAGEGLRVVLYMPTFRDSGGNAVSDDILDLDRLQRHAEANHLLYVFKLHPIDAAKLDPGKRANLLPYRCGCDIYPLLKQVNLLVTDYSSVLFDYLHLDRPEVFFAYDLNHYRTKDRALYFDYCNFVPGPIVSCQDEFERTVIEELNNGGANWVGARSGLIKRCFVHSDGLSSSRIWDMVKDLAK